MSINRLMIAGELREISMPMPRIWPHLNVFALSAPVAVHVETLPCPSDRYVVQIPHLSTQGVAIESEQLCSSNLVSPCGRKSGRNERLFQIFEDTPIETVGWKFRIAFVK